MELTVKIPYIDAVVTHVKKNKKVYILGSGVVIAGITCAIVRGRIEALALRGACGPVNLVTNRPLAFFSKQTNNVFVTIKQEIGRPPYLIHDITDDLWYKSQSAAAKALGASDSTVSQHMTGKAEHVNGHILERILLA